MTTNGYVQWRKELDTLQTKIDEFDEAFYDKFDSIPVDELRKAEEEYKIERQKLIDALNDHYAINEYRI
jgi:hypothetical protein